LTRTWIVYNKPKQPSYAHAGLLMGLGLAGEWGPPLVAALSSKSSMSIYYKMFKKTHKYSEYLSQVKNLHLRAMLTRFRSGCHWLQVNEGRYSDVPR
jgi:hypothetical protein